MVASEHTMADPIHSGNGTYTSNGDTTNNGFARPPTSETAPEQQV